MFRNPLSPTLVEVPCLNDESGEDVGISDGRLLHQSGHTCDIPHYLKVHGRRIVLARSRCTAGFTRYGVILPRYNDMLTRPNNKPPQRCRNKRRKRRNTQREKKKRAMKM
jgi:hypothetical protein